MAFCFAMAHFTMRRKTLFTGGLCFLLSACGNDDHVLDDHQRGPQGCMNDGKTYPVGELFDHEDGCNSCICDNAGNISCSKLACVTGTCALPFEDDDCLGFFEVYWHNPKTRKCQKRGYGGCGGNANKFDTLEECEAACVPGAKPLPIEPDPPTAVRVPPAVVVLLDRSSSEREAGGDRVSRWDATGANLASTLAATEEGIRWGAKVYPDDDTCGVATGIDVECSLENAQNITSLFASAPPLIAATQRPMRSALQQAGTYLEGLPIGPKAIILVTEGAPSCGQSLEDDGAESGIDTDLTSELVKELAAADIPLYVIGLPNLDETGDLALNEIARAGGKAINDPFKPKYHAPSNSAEFQGALDDIINDSFRCVFSIENAPPADIPLCPYLADTTSLRNVSGDEEVRSGWTFLDETTIDLHGEACEKHIGGMELKLGEGCSSW